MSTAFEPNPLSRTTTTDLGIAPDEFRQSVETYLAADSLGELLGEAFDLFPSRRVVLAAIFATELVLVEHERATRLAAVGTDHILLLREAIDRSRASTDDHASSDEGISEEPSLSEQLESCAGDLPSEPASLVRAATRLLAVCDWAPGLLDDPGSNVACCIGKNLDQAASNAPAGFGVALVARIRDHLGSPVSALAAISSDWLTDTVRCMARFAYDYTQFDGLPILADALEEAGCNDELLLNELRKLKPRARGCWELDHILGLT